MTTPNRVPDDRQAALAASVDALRTQLEEEVVEGEIVDDGPGTSLALPEAAGRLTGTPTRRELYEALVAKVQRRSLSRSTRQRYKDAWEEFGWFCEAMDLSMMPTADDPGAHILALKLYLLWCGTERPNAQTHKKGLALSSVDIRAAGIVRQFRHLGLADPHDDTGFADFREALGRMIGAAPAKMTALRLPELRRILEHSLALPLEVTRDHLILLLVHGGLGRSDLHSLYWEDLTVTSTAVIVAERVRARGPNVPARTLPTHREPRLCPVRALRAWREVMGGPKRGPVFPQLGEDHATRFDEHGAALVMPRQSFTAIVRRHAVAAGLPVPPSGTPKLTLADVRVLVRAMHQPRLIDVRDRALLTIGWNAALRRSNLVGQYHAPDAEEDLDDAVFGAQGPQGLRWEHITTDPRGILVFIDRSKTDQTGEGRTVALPRRSGSVTCPEVGFLEWREAFAEAAGLAPADIPGHWFVFPRIDRHGNIAWEDDPEVEGAQHPVRLAPGGLHKMIGERADAVGLVGRYGSHSLRRGFATEAVHQGAPLIATQRHVGWASLTMLGEYVEQRDQWTNNPGSYIKDDSDAGAAA